MKHPFSIRDGSKVAVIRPDDPHLALRLVAQHQAREKNLTVAEREAGFNAILAAQNYTHVGFLSTKGDKLLNEHGWAIGKLRPGDSFINWDALSAEADRQGAQRSESVKKPIAPESAKSFAGELVIEDMPQPDGAKIGVRMTAMDLGVCPCGGSLGTSLPESEEKFVLHSVPACAEYDQMDPLTFVRWVKSKRLS